MVVRRRVVVKLVVKDEEMAEIKLVVGLGNPGIEYANTRHNMGFMVLDKLLGWLPGGVESSSRYESSIYCGRFRGRKLLFQKPATYMNLSGLAVRKLMTADGILPEELLVVYDDMDIEFGCMRMRSNGSSGGHRGMESIIGEIGTEKFSRLRVGIGQVERKQVVDYVLSRFDAADEEKLNRVLTVAGEAVKLSLSRGTAAAMNQYNSWNYDLELEKKQAKADENNA